MFDQKKIALVNERAEALGVEPLEENVFEFAKKNVFSLSKNFGMIVAVFYLGSYDLEPYIYHIRAFYFGSQVMFLCMWAYILMKASANEDARTIDCGLASKNEWKYSKRPKGERKIVSIAEYDQLQTWPKLRSWIMSFVFVVYVHLTWKHAIPLILQAVMTWIELPDQKLVKIYILGRKDTEDESLVRPWQEESIMFPKFNAAMKELKEKQQKEKGVKGKSGKGGKAKAPELKKKK